MCRLIFLLLVMANIVPLFLEGAEKCYQGPIGNGNPASFRLCSPSNSNNGKGACYSFDCSPEAEAELKSGRESRMGCGTCEENRLKNDNGCKCTQCTDDFCNGKKGPVNQCYGKQFNYTSGKFEKVDCIANNNGDCFTITNEQNGGKLVDEYENGCGKCPPKEELTKGYKCDDCHKNSCNDIKPKGSIKKCYGGVLRIAGKFEKETCLFVNNDACRTVEFEIEDEEITEKRPDELDRPKYIPSFSNGPKQKKDKPIPNIVKSCGKCPAPEEMNLWYPGVEYKCTECIGELCNTDQDKGSIKQCFEGKDGKFKPGNCTFFNNDGCRTFDCEGKDLKGCGKCPANSKMFPEGFEKCKCSECDGDMCNKEVFVDKCYFGDDQKGYEVMECHSNFYKNKACKKVVCHGGMKVNRVVDENGKNVGGVVGNVYRGCGMCSEDENKGDCKCHDCVDKDLCNGGLRIESTSFVLAMIGGVVALVAMKPLVGIGI